MKRIRLICMMAVVAIVTASFTSREDRNYFSVEKVYTDPNSHMNVSVPGRVYYVLHNTTQGGLCKLL